MTDYSLLFRVGWFQHKPLCVDSFLSSRGCTHGLPPATQTFHYCWHGVWRLQILLSVSLYGDVRKGGEHGVVGHAASAPRVLQHPTAAVLALHLCNIRASKVLPLGRYGNL